MNLCLHCRRRLRTCVCSQLCPFETNSRFLILMHPMEHKKEKVGTGRFTHLILKNSEIIVDVGFDENPRFLDLLQGPEYETFVLYPGDRAMDLSASTPEAWCGKRKQFIVIDGTWPCAKKMMRLTTALHGIPRVSFCSARTSEFKIKQQPLPGCLSTVESVHQVLEELNRLKVECTGTLHDNLLEVFRKSVAQQIQLAQDPGQKGYRRKPLSLPEDRKVSKKWSKRSLYFTPLDPSLC